MQKEISSELRRIRARVLARIDGDEMQDSEDDGVIDAEAGAEPSADADAQVKVEVGAGAETDVLITGTATAVPATDQVAAVGEMAIKKGNGCEG